MSRLLRADLDELDVYVSRIAEATGIPAPHIEKDYWVTEVASPALWQGILIGSLRCGGPKHIGLVSQPAGR